MSKYTIFYRGCDTEVHGPEKHGRPQYFSKINIFEDVNMPNNSSGSTIIDLTKYPNQILRQGDGAYTL